MNKKLIAAAVSAAVIAPVAAQAESEVYVSLRNVVDINDLTGDGTTDVNNLLNSRLGFKGNTDIGNGLTVHGQLEFNVTSDKEKSSDSGVTTNAVDKDDDPAVSKKDGDSGGVNDVRVATVGLSGSFGRVDVGNQWSAYFNTFGTLISPTYTLGYYLYSSVGGGPYRASNTIKYANTFGPLYAELDVRLNDSNEGSDVAEKIRGNGIGLGLSFNVTDNITIAAAFDSEEGAEGAVTAATPGNPPVLASADYAAAVPHDTGGLDAVAPVLNADGSVTPGTAAVPHTSGGSAQVGTAAVTANAPTAASKADDGDDTDRVGISVKATFGDFWGSIGHQSYEKGDAEVDTTFAWVGGSLSDKTSWILGYATADDAKDAVAAVGTVAQVGNVGDNNYVAPVNPSPAVAGTDDSTQITWGVYHNLGGGMKLFYEAVSLDSGDNDGDRHLIGMKVDF